MINTLTEVNDDVIAEIKAEMAIRKTSEMFLLFALGSQFDHLIKTAFDKQGVYCLVADPNQVHAADVERLREIGLIGLTLSGGPVSVYIDTPDFDGMIFELGIPVLGICLGAQLIAHHLGAAVSAAEKSEYGTHELTILDVNHPSENLLFADIPYHTPVLQSHTDSIMWDMRLDLLASTDNATVGAFRHRHLWGVQFHPEVSDTIEGPRMFENFIFRICGAKDQFPAVDAAAAKIAQLKQEIGTKKVLLALSGGSDSATVAYLLKQAVPGQIHAVYIKGIDRPDDEAYVHRYFGDVDWLELEVVDATDEFLDVLAGKIDMRDKRVAMRGVYKGILEDRAAVAGASFIAQGTLYTDISESGSGYSGGRRAQIKLHHNTNLGFNLPELMPLSDCVKDSGRQIGRAVGAPEELMLRHPFPGPGLVVRIEGEVTAEKLAMAHQADDIYIEELRQADLYDGVWQAGAVITQSVTTCTKGDDAKSGFILALWAVWSVNGFTATWAELPNDFLRHVSKRLTNEIRDVGGVVYRISDKPPTTIEWG